MVNKSSYKSSSPRLTKRDENQQRISAQILEYIENLDIEKDAETIWLEMKALGVEMSMPTFYVKLKKLVEAGMVKKKPVAYNKNYYSV